MVGDRFQSIYGFRGADPDAIPRMERVLGETTDLRKKQGRGLVRLPLTVTRRCPLEVVELAKTLVPDFEPMEGARQGLIAQEAFEEMTRSVATRGKWLAPGTMVICRINAPLIKAFYKLTAKQVKSFIRGRDIGEGLVALLKSVHRQMFGRKAKDDPESRSMLPYLDKMEIEECDQLKKAGASERSIEAFKDKVECLREVLKADGGERWYSESMTSLEKMFSDRDEKGSVVLSSGHKAKGRESETVIVLEPQLIPFPKAVQPWEMQQELNLAYVMATRSKDRLVFCGEVPRCFEEYEVEDFGGADNEG